MTPLTTPTRISLAIALLVPSMGSLWLLAVPNTVAPSTYAISAALLTALSAIAMMTYKNGQTTGSMGQLKRR